jgi:hypothetical protein
VFYPKDAHILNKMFDEDNDKYAVTLGELSDAACEKLKELDIRVKEKDVPKKHIVAKSKFVFKFETEDGNEIPTDSIGGGTKVHVLLTPYRHKLSAKHGASPSVKKLIVTELVEYAPTRSTEDAEEAL